MPYCLPLILENIKFCQLVISLFCCKNSKQKMADVRLNLDIGQLLIPKQEILNSLIQSN